MPKDFVRMFNNKYPGLLADKVHPDGVVPVFGLAVPMD